jgi:hypothetical protein
MVTDLNLRRTGLETMSWSNPEDSPWSASKEQRPRRSLDCAAMARMALPSLLYYILVGDGRVNQFG